MNLKEIKNLDELEILISEYSANDSLTNNYILVDDLRQFIEKKEIFSWGKDSNFFIFIQKQGFYRLYYIVNNVNVQYDFSKINIVIEIVYRGEARIPLDHIKYWEKSNFRSHLTRDCYFLDAASIQTDHNQIEGVTIQPPKTEKDIFAAKRLIDENLDLYTGDRLSLHEIKKFIARGLFFCAYKDNLMCGMLQADLKNNIYWLGHIVVHEDYRGMGLASLLIDTYLGEGLKLLVRGFQLWVIHDNIPAINLYKKKGFAYLNKSTHSMLKDNK